MCGQLNNLDNCATLNCILCFELWLEVSHRKCIKWRFCLLCLCCSIWAVWRCCSQWEHWTSTRELRLPGNTRTHIHSRLALPLIFAQISSVCISTASHGSDLVVHSPHILMHMCTNIHSLALVRLKAPPLMKNSCSSLKECVTERERKKGMLNNDHTQPFSYSHNLSVSSVLTYFLNNLHVCIWLHIWRVMKVFNSCYL